MAIRLMTRAAFALAATPVERAIKPMVELLDNPPSEPFVARWKKKPVDLGKKAFDAEDALRLKYITEQLVGVR